jgi:class 3 adenylate cyclase
MQQIADWLKILGMSEYAERSAKNHIDLSVLPELTDQHLEKLDIALGDRLKILRAIRELSAEAVAQRTAPAAPVLQGSAERRQLTVMFCDLVGSTPLSGRVDPEDLRGIIRAYHRCCTELIERNGGFVAKYMGDGVLAYFRYPQAHEHDAERAVRAALNLVEAVPKLATHAGLPLQVRVGIATGLVVVGDLIGAGAAQEQAVVGETEPSRPLPGVGRARRRCHRCVHTAPNRWPSSRQSPDGHECRLFKVEEPSGDSRIPVLMSSLRPFYAPNDVAFSADVMGDLGGAVPGVHGEVKGDRPVHERSQPHGCSGDAGLLAASLLRGWMRWLQAKSGSPHRPTAEPAARPSGFGVAPGVIIH